MECEFFAILVDELACERLSDTALTRRLFKHARECPECGRRLNEARALTESLRALAAADAQEQAPDSVEEGLLSYLRRSRRVVRFWKGKWVAVAASACLIAVGLAIWARHGSQPVRNNQPVIMVPEIPPAPRNKGRVEVTVQPGVSTTSPSTGRTVSTSEPNEYSGFIPLPYGEGLDSLGTGQIVRVDVARSALASMGFPVTGAASESYVQADVLIGEDGVARAIRFDSQEDDSSR